MKKPKYHWTPEMWNALYPIGTRVRVTSLLSEDGRPQDTFDTVTRSKCWALGDGNPVVLVEGTTGGYSVEPGWMTVLVGDVPALRKERDGLRATLLRIRDAYNRYTAADVARTVANAMVYDSVGVDLAADELEWRRRSATNEHASALAGLQCVLSDELSIFREDGFPSRLDDVETWWHEEFDLRKKVEAERDELRKRITTLEAVCTDIVGLREWMADDRNGACEQLNTEIEKLIQLLPASGKDHND